METKNQGKPVTKQNQTTSKSTKSQAIKEIVFAKVDVKNFAVNFAKVYSKKEKLWEPNPETIQKAYDKIVTIWNKDAKSQGFLKHLVNAFLPYQSLSRALSLEEGKNYRCAILGTKLTSIQTISQNFAKYSMTKMFVDAKAVTENRKEYSEEELAKINGEMDKMPVEVRTSSIAYLSDKSDKILQDETVIALKHFVENMLLIEGKMLLYIKNKPRLSSNNVTKPKPLKPIVLQDTVSNMVDDNTFSKLEQLKVKMMKDE